MVSKSISIMETGINHRPHMSLMLLGAGRVSPETGNLTFHCNIFTVTLSSEVDADILPTLLLSHVLLDSAAV